MVLVPNAGMETLSGPSDMPLMALKAILVEDSQTIRDSLLPALEELANTEVVAWAQTFAQAEHVLAEWQGRWQLIIVDLFLGGGTGLDVLTAVRNRGKGQHAVVLSNYATEEMRRRCMGLGAVAVFDKSTEIGAFIEWCIATERTI